MPAVNEYVPTPNGAVLNETFSDRFRFFAEFAFYDAVERYNDQAVLRGDDLIDFTEARVIHKYGLDGVDWDAEFVAYEGMDRRRAVARRIEAAFANMGRQIDMSDVVVDSQGRQQSIIDAEFSDYQQLLFGQGVVPVSPHDARFRHLRSMAGIDGDSVWNDMTSLFCFSRSDAVDLDALRSSVDSFVLGGARVGRLNRVIEPTSTGYEIDTYKRGEDVVPVSLSMGRHAADVIGVGIISHHLSNDEIALFNEVAEEISDRSVLDSPETLRRYRMAFHRVDAVMDWLEANGIPYEITRDMRRGQLRLSIDDPSVNMRVLDRPDDIRYMGSRLYSDGVVIDTADASTSNAAKERVYDTTPAEAVDHLRLVFGEDVIVAGEYSTNGRNYRYTHHLGSSELVGLNDRGVDRASYSIANGEGKKGAFTIRRMGRVADALGQYQRDFRETYIERWRSPRNPWLDNKVYYTELMETSGERLQDVPVSERAARWLRHKVSEARVAFDQEFAVDDLVAFAMTQVGADEPEDYDLSIYDEVGTIQQECLDFMLGKRDTLPAIEHAGLVDEETTDDVELDVEEPDEETVGFAQDDFDGRVAAVRKYYDRLRDFRIGPDPNRGDLSYNIAGVSTWSSSIGGDGNHTRLVIMDATREAGIPIERLLGDDVNNRRAKDGLISFDESTSVPIANHDSAFVRRMGEHVRSVLLGSGAIVNDNVWIVDQDGNRRQGSGLDIRIDDQGIVRYRCLVSTRKNGYYNAVTNGSDLKLGKEAVEVEGTIGQLFEPNEDGVIVTRYASSDNYACVPGYSARIVSNMSPTHAQQTLEERTRLDGYEQIMARTIRHRVRVDMLSVTEGNEGGVTHIRSATRLNKVYANLYDERLDLDYMTRARDGAAMSRDEVRHAYGEDAVDQYYTKEDAVDLMRLAIRTLRGRVSYGDGMRSDATVFAAHAYEHNKDNRTSRHRSHTREPYRLTGRADLSVIGENSNGYFDHMLTGTGMGQGIVRYLVDGAQIDPVTGSIVPAEDAGAKAPIMAHDALRYIDHNPADRGQMVAMSMMHFDGLSGNVMVMCAPVDGFGQDDGFPVTKAFAERCRIHGRDNEFRPLRVGDKICGPGGDKGVISLVIDPDMDDDEARERGIFDLVMLARDNPDLGVIMPAFSAGSRFNGATYLMMNEHTEDLVLRDAETGEKKVVSNGLGQCNFIITDKSADVKTNVYDEEAYLSGRGRRASSQLCWSIDSKYARFAKSLGTSESAIKREFYGKNDAAIRSVYEYMLILGINMGPDGQLSLGCTEEDCEGRRIVDFIHAQDSSRCVTTRSNANVIDTSSVRRMFDFMIERQGGFLALPFPLETYADVNELDRSQMLKFAQGKKDRQKAWEKYPKAHGATLPLTEDGTAVETNPDRLAELGYVQHVADMTGRPSGAWTLSEKAASAMDQDVRFALPLMSASVRSGVERADGEYQTHDFTKTYSKIAMHATRYEYARDLLEHGRHLSEYRDAFISSFGGTLDDAFGEPLTADVLWNSAKVGAVTERAKAPTTFLLMKRAFRALVDRAYESDVELLGDDAADEAKERRLAALGEYVDALCGSHLEDRTEGEAEFLSDEFVRQYEQDMQYAQSSAQTAYDAMCATIVDRRVESKYNMFKTGVMAHRLRDSATSIVTPDPRLDLDEIAISRAMADAMSLDDGDSVLIWRDPQLRDSGMAYVHVKVDDEIDGLAMNPSLSKQFDGDFDGDTYAVKSLDTPAARREAEMIFSVHNNLIDRDFVRNPECEDPADLRHPLIFQDGLDVKIASHFDSDLAERFETLEREANETDKAYRDGRIDFAEFDRRNRLTMRQVNELYHDVYSQPIAQVALRFAADVDESVSADERRLLDAQAHMDSVYAACVETGAKGSAAKLQVYAKNIGFETEFRKDGDDVVGLDVVAVHDQSLFTSKEQAGVQKAQAIKAGGTGVAGRYSQRGIAACRCSCPSAVLAMTYPVTQAILQAKHDPEDAARRYDMLMGCMKELWSGHSLEWSDEKGIWTASEELVSSEEWAASAKAFYYSDDGLATNVDPECIDTVSRALAGEHESMESIVFGTFNQLVAKDESISEEVAADVARDVVVRGVSEAVEHGVSDLAAHVNGDKASEFAEVMDALAKGRVVERDGDSFVDSGRAAEDVSEWLSGLKRFCRDNVAGISSMVDSEWAAEHEGRRLQDDALMVSRLFDGMTDARVDDVMEGVACDVGHVYVAAKDLYVAEQRRIRGLPIDSVYQPARCAVPLDKISYAEKSRGNEGLPTLVREATRNVNLFGGPSVATDSVESLRQISPSESFAPNSMHDARDIAEGKLVDRRENASISKQVKGSLNDLFGIDNIDTYCGKRRKSLGGRDVRSDVDVLEDVRTGRASDMLIREMIRSGASRYVADHSATQRVPEPVGVTGSASGDGYAR